MGSVTRVHSQVLAFWFAAAFPGCGLLVSSDAPLDGGLSTPHDVDGGALRDGGPRRDAGPGSDAGPRDAGPQDAGPPDAGPPLDAGADADAGPVVYDAGDEPDAADAGGGTDELDAGLWLDDAGPGDVDAGGEDGGAPRFVVLGSGSAVSAASVPLSDAELQDLSSVVIFLTREEVAVVDLPGNWSGPTYRSTGSGSERIVGTTRDYQDPPSTLENPLPIGVQSGERFSYALIGIVGLAAPSGDDAVEGDTTIANDCAGIFAVSHDLSRGYAFTALTALSHRGAPAKATASGIEILKEEPALGPSLLVQEVTSDPNNAASSRSCVSAEGRFVSVAQYFRLP